MTFSPFARGAVALGLTPIGMSGRAVVTRLVAEAHAAENAGFDGVTLSEHHAGCARSLPAPMTVVAAQLLARLERAWAAPCPAILPLRNPVLVAEELAWLDAAYPGRVGAGFVAGYQPPDFAVTGTDFSGRAAAYWRGLTDLVTALGGGIEPSPIAADPAISDLAGAGVPLLAGVGGLEGVRRAARTGVGLLLTSLRTAVEQGALVDAYREAGGTRPVVLIRRVQVGARTSGFRAGEAAWLRRSERPAWLAADAAAVVSGTRDELAEGLSAAVRSSGCDALDLRLDSYTTDPARVRDDIGVLADVLPRVREAFGRGSDAK